MNKPKRSPGRPKGPRPPKRQYPLKLDEEMRAQLVAAAYWTRQSANAIVERGIGIMLRQLQEAHNRGKPFPPKPGQRLPAEAQSDATDDGQGQPAPRAKPKRQRGRPRKE